MNILKMMRSKLNFANLLLVLCFITVACGQATVAPEEAVEPAAPISTEVVSPAETEVPIPSTEQQSSISLDVWFTGTAQDQDFFVEKVKEFQEQNPDIEAQVTLLSFQDFTQKLLTSLVAGVSPDIATLSLNEIVSLAEEGFVVPLEGLDQSYMEDFLRDSLESVSINGNQMGLPLRRHSCAPVYQYLSQFRQASEHPEEVFRLLEFLTTTELQIQANEALGWVPTRISAYESLDFECPGVEAIRLAPPDVLDTISRVEQLGSELDPILEGFTLNPYEATAVIENGEVQGTGAALLQPVDLNYAQERLSSEGLIFGGLFVDNAPEYPPGNYALICWADGVCKLATSDGTTIDVEPEVFEETDNITEKPIVVVETGSKKKCYYILNWEVCVRVG